MKIDYSASTVENLIVHRVGNKFREENYTFSKNTIIDKKVFDLSLRHFLSPMIEKGELYEFFHESDIDLNPIYFFSSQLFNKTISFEECSEKISKHLYSVSMHPKIQMGEVFIIQFDNLEVDNALTSALGIFKVESKEDYFDIIDSKNSILVKEKEGISLSKIQKGALIVGSNLNLFIIDSISQKTHYWYESFLKAKLKPSPQKSALLVSKAVKKVSDNISNPNEKLEYRNKIVHVINSTDEVNFNNIKDISKEYLVESVVDSCFKELDNQVFHDEETQIEISSLNKYTSKVFNQISLIPGLNLNITAKEIQILNIQISEDEGTLKAIIEINKASK